MWEQRHLYVNIISNSANSEIAFTAGTSGVSSILFGDGLTGADVYKGYLQYNHAQDKHVNRYCCRSSIEIDNTQSTLSEAEGNNGGLLASNSFTIVKPATTELNVGNHYNSWKCLDCSCRRETIL